MTNVRLGGLPTPPLGNGAASGHPQPAHGQSRPSLSQPADPGYLQPLTSRNRAPAALLVSPRQASVPPRKPVPSPSPRAALLMPSPADFLPPRQASGPIGGFFAPPQHTAGSPPSSPSSYAGSPASTVGSAFSTPASTPPGSAAPSPARQRFGGNPFATPAQTPPMQLPQRMPLPTPPLSATFQPPSRTSTQSSSGYHPATAPRLSDGSVDMVTLMSQNKPPEAPEPKGLRGWFKQTKEAWSTPSSPGRTLGGNEGFGSSHGLDNRSSGDNRWG